MKEYNKNPRRITPQQFAKLKENIEELGDLSGIVHDLNTDEIISGNQRSKIIDINNCTIEIVSKNEAPDRQGTVATGYVIWENQKLNYRQVRWTEDQRERANITANRLGGEFDYNILEEKFKIEDLTKWGFKAEDFETFDVLGDLEENQTFQQFVKASSNDFAMTFLLPKVEKYATEVYLRTHTKKFIAQKVIDFVKTFDNERV